jgi:hypothetical protein
VTSSLFDPGWPVLVAVALVLGALVATVVSVARGRRRPAVDRPPGVPRGMLVVLVGVAIVAALAVAVLGGVRSFDAVSARFGSPAVPLTADGMVVACTALRLAALAQGWRLPGSLLVTYVFILGTVWLNIDAATSGTDRLAHALAPVSYAVLVEMLAHLLRLHLRLAAPASVRITALTWATSPVISTRVWLHLARTGEVDPVAARALVQQVTRMESRLRAVCPGGRWPFGGARLARAAAVQTVRDGLLGAADLAALLPPPGQALTPGDLLALVDGAALGLTSTRQRAAGVPVPVSPGVPAQSVGAVPDTGTGSAAPSPAGTPAASGRAVRTDAELLAVLAGRSGPIGVRAAARELGCGVNRARRLLAHAGLLARPADPEPSADRPVQSGQPPTEESRSLHLVPTSTTSTDQ